MSNYDALLYNKLITYHCNRSRYKTMLIIVYNYCVDTYHRQLGT